MTPESCLPRRGRAGFTLIEVLGALVIFTGGVLAVMRLSDSLGRSMERSSATSEIVALAHEKVDSLGMLPFDSLFPGTVSDTVRVGRFTFARSTQISVVTGILYRLDVVMAATDSLAPGYSVTSYVADTW